MRLKKLEVGARTIHPKEGNANTVFRSVADGVGGTPNRLIARNAVSLQLDLADGHFNHCGLQSEAEQLFHIPTSCAGKAPNLGVFQARLQDQRDGFPVFLRHLGKPCFDATHAEFVQFLGDFEFLLRTENDADRLLAVA